MDKRRDDAALEKREVNHADDEVTHDDTDDLKEYGPIDEKALLRRTDLRLLPWLSLLYLLSFLDRSNIGNANVFGLTKQLGLESKEYSTALAVFFAFYVMFEVPSNLVMKAWRPSLWLPLIMIGWGAVIIGMGFIRGYSSLLVCRVLLGITEAGLFPGVSYFLTQWYRRYQVNFRIAIFFSAATAAGAFGGLLARLINEMDGLAGYAGWRWIFIIEGIATVLIAFSSFWMLYDYPDTASFLRPHERRHVIASLKLDDDGCSRAFKGKFVWSAVGDWKVWAFAVMYQGGLMPVYCFSLFSPTLTANLGYTAAKAQLMSVPPYIVAAFTTILAGYLSDRLQKRGIVAMGFSLIGGIGFLLLLVSKIARVQYAGLFLAAAGVYPLIAIIVAWGANNAGGSTKKSVATAIVISIGNAGGVISSFIYPSTDAPRYTKGHAICLGYCAMVFLSAGFMSFYLGRQNKKKDERNAARPQPWTAEERLEFQDHGDKVDWFRYTI